MDVIRPLANVLVTTRKQGAASAPYYRGNLAQHVGDDAQAVAQNRLAVQQLLPANTAIQWMQQVHGSDVVAIASVSSGIVADGVWTTQRNIALAVMTADCVPVVLHSNEAIAVLHCGWRSIAGGIISKALQQLQRYTTFKAWIGPAICQCCYQVDAPVRDAMLALDASNEQYCVADGSQHWKIDLPALVASQLAGYAVAVTQSGFCTYHQPELWFSHRHSRQCGRFATMVWR